MVTEATQAQQRQAHWRAVLERQKHSGLTAAAFCKSEGVALQTFYWWRAKLRHGTSAAGHAQPDMAAPFVDLGALRTSETVFDIRLELPGGVVLTIGRS
ncbi:MAG TPA: hypothetical protein VF450_02695 [Noviherbaspirillum sp.]